MRARSPPPTRSTSSTRPARPGSPKGVVRDNGGHAVALRWSMPNVYDVASRRGVLGGLRRRLGGRPLLHRLRAAADRRDDRPLRGQARRHARPGRVLARDRAARGRRRCSPRRRRSARSARRIPRPALLGGRDAAAPAHAVPGRRAPRPRHLRLGDAPAAAARDRPLVADRDGLADRRELPRPRAAAGQARLADPARARADASRSSTPTAASSRAASRARSSSGCRCRPARCRRSGTTTSASSQSYLARYPGRYLTGDGGHLDEDGYLFVMGRIDDVINVAGHRLSTGAMEEVVATHPDVAECAVIGVARRAARPGAARPRGAQGGRRARRAAELRDELVALVRERVGAGRLLPRRPRRRAPAEDALGQDPARDDARDRRRPRRTRCRPRSTTRRSSTRSPACSVPVAQVPVSIGAWPRDVTRSSCRCSQRPAPSSATQISCRRTAATPSPWATAPSR